MAFKQLGVLVAVSMLTVSGSAGAGKSSFSFKGMYVEGCSCNAPCPCELTGVQMGCEGVGFFSFTSGSYNGMDFDGTRGAYAVKPGDYLVIYVDAPNEAKRKAVAEFMKAAFKDWGKLEGVESAKIKISGKGGNYVCTIGNGSEMSLTTKAVMGGDKKTPMSYHNINSPLHSTVMQATSVKCHFKRGNRSFDLKDSNGYFNPSLNSKGMF